MVAFERNLPLQDFTLCNLHAPRTFPSLFLHTHTHIQRAHLLVLKCTWYIFVNVDMYYIFIYCMRLAFVNVAFFIHGIISHIYTHTQRHSCTDYKVVVATFRRMLFASCSECRKSSPAIATAAAEVAGKNIKIKLIYCIRRTVFLCVCVQAVFLSSLN